MTPPITAAHPTHVILTHVDFTRSGYIHLSTLAHTIKSVVTVLLLVIKPWDNAAIIACTNYILSYFTTTVARLYIKLCKLWHSLKVINKHFEMQFMIQAKLN